MGEIAIRAVTPESWGDLETLFQGASWTRMCWCTVFREVPGNATDREARSGEMERRVASGEPVGLLAYDAERVVGWCSVAPRATYVRLGGATYDLEEERVWSLVCFYVDRAYRGSGLQHRLLDAAIERARSMGARVLEAYPVLPDSPSYRYGGLVPRYERAGFTHRKLAGSRRHVMSLDL